MNGLTGVSGGIVKGREAWSVATRSGSCGDDIRAGSGGCTIREGVDGKAIGATLAGGSVIWRETEDWMADVVPATGELCAKLIRSKFWKIPIKHLHSCLRQKHLELPGGENFLNEAKAKEVDEYLLSSSDGSLCFTLLFLLQCV